ncbi:MAG TPA: hypothetical protein ENO02_10205 [Epsilonproteobacteria bacterium]|nr:hypothetical protein [Campylobacterota bacterium]
MKKQLHFTINQKGGCGKTHLAYCHLTRAMHHGITCTATDTDPSNSSLADYQGLPVNTIDIMDENGLEINPQQWDILIYHLLDTVTEDITVVDLGATSFQSFVSYSVNSNIMELLKDKFDIYLNIPVVGGEALYDTTNGLQYLVELFADNTKIVVWINEHFGKLKGEKNESFEETETYLAVKEKLHGVVYLRRMDTLQDLAVSKMKTAKLTYEEVKQNKNGNFQLLEMMRINIVMNKTFEMMDLVFDIPTNTKKSKEKETVK